MSDEVYGFDEAQVERLSRALVAIEAGRFNQTPSQSRQPHIAPQDVLVGKTTTVITAASGSTPGSGTVARWKRNPESGEYSDAELSITAYNPSGSAIALGTWVQLSRDPHSGGYWALPYVGAGGVSDASYTQAGIITLADQVMGTGRKRFVEGIQIGGSTSAFPSTIVGGRLLTNLGALAITMYDTDEVTFAGLTLQSGGHTPTLMLQSKNSAGAYLAAAYGAVDVFGFIRTGATGTSGGGDTVHGGIITSLGSGPASVAWAAITGTPTTATGYGIASINAVPIGGTTPAAGAFTTLSATTPIAPSSGGTGLASLTGSGAPAGGAGQAGSVYFDVSDPNNPMFYWRT